MRRLPLLLAAVLAGCSVTGPDAVGTWGGTEASLVLSRTGGVLSYPCGAGTIAAGWTLDTQGRFTAAGAHFMGGGPAPATGRPPHPATYAGTVRGGAFTFSVTVPDLSTTLGPYRMVRGGPAVTEVCL